MYSKLTDIQYVNNTISPLYINTTGATAIKEISFFNTNATAEIVTIYNVPNNAGALGTPTDAHKIWEGTIQPNSNPDINKKPPSWDYPIELSEVNDAIFAITTTASQVTAMVLGDNDTTTAVNISNLMTKNPGYDTNLNGIVDNSELLGGQNLAYVLNLNNATGTTTSTSISDFQTAVENYSINEVSEDTSPQLGGNLDVDGFAIGNGTNEVNLNRTFFSSSQRLNTSNVGAGTNFDLSTSNDFSRNAIAANTTFTVSNTPAGLFIFTLYFIYTSGIITWFSGINWDGGSAPVLSTTKSYEFTFKTRDGGTNWLGSISWSDE